MARKPKELAEKGSDTAQEMYALVGVALSWWEASEDLILGLFRALCGETEPVAMESFIHAPRGVRYSMLRLAMKTYSHLILSDDIKKVDAALKSLDKLAPVRNEIAHGHVSEYSEIVDDVTTATGNYLLPSLNENSVQERSFRFHHTPETLHAFVADVRKWRGDIMDVQMSTMMKFHTLKNFGSDAQAFSNMISRIHRLEINGYDAVDKLKNVIEFVDKSRSGEFSFPSA